MSIDTPPLLTDSAPRVSRFLARESAGRAGIARVDITPPVGVRAHNWGASRVGVATGIHRPLTATALAIEDGDGVGLVITADLGWWGSTTSFLEVFEPLVAAIGIARDDVLLHLIHTHAGPSLAESEGDLPGADLLREYRERLIAALIAVAKDAIADLAPAVMTWGVGRCGLAVNRDLPCGVRDVVGFNPDIPADDTVLVGRLSGADGTVRGTVLNYACHPTTLAFHNTEISPDYIGAARAIVEADTAAPMLFLQGASGDLSPRDQYGPGTETTDRNGRSLGHAALAVLEAMPTAATEFRFDGVIESGAPLAMWSEHPVSPPEALDRARLDLPFPIRPALTEDELREHWAHIDPVAAAERAARASRVAEGYADGDEVRHPVWIWQWGDAVIVAHPGEAFSLLQTELRRRHPDRAIVVMNITNGPGFVYLPTREAYEHDRYQVWQTLLRPGALEQLIDEVDRRIAALPAPRAVTA